LYENFFHFIFVAGILFPPFYLFRTKMSELKKQIDLLNVDVPHLMRENEIDIEGLESMEEDIDYIFRNQNDILEQARISWGIHGLPKVSLGLTKP
jgi:hypothetical protein